MCLLIAVACLTTGGVVYLLWRSPTLWMFDWLTSMGLDAPVRDLRILTARYKPPTWILYSFPDGAWAFSGTLTMRAIWFGSEILQRHFWIGLIPALALGSEFGQLLRMVPGEFDYSDLLASLAGIILTFSLKITKNKQAPYSICKS
jgi:hypothetical protein